MKLKKVLVAAMTAVMAISALAACGSNDENKGGEAETTTQAQEQVQATEESALKLMETVWASFDEDYKFPVMGGDAAAGIMDNAGSFSLEDAASVDAMLGVPEASVSNISEAASLIHMMNANTFTGAAFKTADGAAAKALAAEIEKHLATREWMCGFPEKLYIATTADGFVVSAFGAGDLMSVFAEKLTGAYTVEVVVDKNLE